MQFLQILVAKLGFGNEWLCYIYIRLAESIAQAIVTPNSPWSNNYVFVYIQCISLCKDHAIARSICIQSNAK